MVPDDSDENVIVQVPTNDPALGPVEFPYTTKYHWPNFDLNATEADEDDFEVVNGPNLFRKGVELKKGQDKCLIDQDFAYDEDACFRNPKYCEKGFSFSLFYKPNYAMEPQQFFNASKTFGKQYIVSTGGDKGTPGFAIFIQGGDIGAVVSTGNLTWQVQVKGGAPDDKTWTNLAIKWELPKFKSALELEQKLVTEKKKLHELGGLQLFRNLELIGQVFHADEDTFGDDGEHFDPPEIMVGCHRTPQDDGPRLYSHGSYDELAYWARALNRTEEVFFLGGYKEVFEDVTTDDLLKILNFIDYADVNQADTAIVIVDSIVNGDEEEEDEFRDIYPNTTPSSLPTEEGDFNGTTPVSTSTTTKPLPPVNPTKDVKNLMKIAAKLTQVSNLNYYMTEREFNIRIKAVGPFGQFMGLKGKYAPGWDALKKDKNQPGPYATQSQLIDYVRYLTERYTISPPDSQARQIQRVIVTDNFALETYKLSAKNYGKLGTINKGQYWRFPNWNSQDWAKAKNSFGYTQSEDQPTETVDVPTELFTEDCRNRDVNFVGSISDTFPDHGRKNPAFISANRIELDSRVVTVDVSANQLNTDKESGDYLKFGQRCQVDPKLIIKNPLKFMFAIKSKRNHDYGRKPRSYYDRFDDKRVRQRHCVIWNPNLGPYGAWDKLGVTLVKADDSTATCYATKLGTVAIVAEIEDEPTANDDEGWLNIIKIIGYAISIIVLLIFIGVVLSSTYLWEMFHLLAVHMAFCLLFGHIFMLVSDMESVRDHRDSCTAIGLVIHFFYSALATLTTMESYAVFKAVISGVIGGHTRTYLCYGYGTPLIHLGVSMYLYLKDMGTDPRCMVGWNNEVKEAFYIPVAVFGVLSVLCALVVLCNINTPAMRKESIVEELGSLAKGLSIFVLLYALTWSWFPFAYMRFPNYEFPDFYPAFQVMNSFMGLYFFVFVGLMSKRFRTALTGGVMMRRQVLLAKASGEEEFPDYTEQVDEDSLVTMDEDVGDSEDPPLAPTRPPTGGSRPTSGHGEDEPDLEGGSNKSDQHNEEDDPDEESSPNPDPLEEELA